MGISRALDFAIGGMVLVLVLFVILGVIFGFIGEKTDLGGRQVDDTGHRAAAFFHVATSEGEFGMVEKSALNNRIEENDGDPCHLNEPGMKEDEDLSIAVQGGKCSEAIENFIGAITISSLYDQEEESYYLVGVSSKNNIKQAKTNENLPDVSP